MKILKQSLVGIALLVSATGFAQTADEVVGKYLNAIGGKDNWKKINSIISEGSMQVQGTDVFVVSTVQQGVGSRQDITVMGMTGYQIMTPGGGWSYMPFQGQTKAEPTPEELTKKGADQYDAQGMLVDYREKGHTVEYQGTEAVDGTEYVKLKISQKTGKIYTYYLDPTTYYLVKSITRQNVNGQDMELTTLFSNYQKLPEGILVPMSVTVPIGPGLTADMTINKVAVNKPIPDTTFKPSN